MSDKTVTEILDSFTDKQKNYLYAVIGQILNGTRLEYISERLVRGVLNKEQQLAFDYLVEEAERSMTGNGH